MNKKAAIIANGRFCQKDAKQLQKGDYDFSVACDGAGKALLDQGILPDLLVGDFDSILPDDLELLKSRGVAFQQYPAEKDDTDLQLAIDIAMDKGYRVLDLYGAVGSRLDHSLANIMLLYHIRKRGGEGRLIDAGNVILAGRETMKISRKEARSLLFEEGEPGILYVSLLLLDDCRGITLRGFRYPLTDFQGSAGETRCISNELEQEQAEISFRQGRLLVVFSRD